MECINCVECNMDVSTLEKNCSFSNHWVVVSESDSFFGGWKVYICVMMVWLVFELLVY
jgi:hypothetical protein